MAKASTKKVTKKRVKKNVERGQAHIQASFNNTIVTLTDAEGNEFVPTGETLGNIAHIDMSEMAPELKNVEIITFLRHFEYCGYVVM